MAIDSGSVQKFNYHPMPQNARLEVNENNKIHQVFEKSEAEGVQELREHCAKSRREEGWIYVRGEDANTGKEVELWYEVGSNETQESAKLDYRNLGSIKKDLEDRDVKAQEWSFYHFHPEQSEHVLFNRTLTIDNGPFVGQLSPGDYLTSASSEGYRQAYLSDMPPILMKVVTSEGIWTSQLTKDIDFERGDKVNKDPKVRWNIFRPKKQYQRKIDKQEKSCFKRGKCKMDYQKIEKRLSTKYMKVDFEPFDKETSQLRKDLDLNKTYQNLFNI